MKINYNNQKFQVPLFTINQKIIFQNDFLMYVEKNQNFISTKDFQVIELFNTEIFLAYSKFRIDGILFFIFSNRLICNKFSLGYF